MTLSQGLMGSGQRTEANYPFYQKPNVRITVIAVSVITVIAVSVFIC